MIDRGLADFSGDTMQKGMSESEILRIQTNLFGLLAKRVERYTMGDSSSVRLEVAEELFKSICFSMRMQSGRMEDISELTMKDFERLLKESQVTLEEKIGIGKKLFERVKETTPVVDNRSYMDTINGIGAFFRLYDYRFFAHEIPGDIDYQLCHPVPGEMQGIEYINEYLRRLLIENEFCSHFSPEWIISLLESYCVDYKGLLINIYHPVATNIIGSMLLDKQELISDISDSERAYLESYFAECTEDEAKTCLETAAVQVCLDLQIKEESTRSYLKRTAGELLVRVGAASGDLHNIFISIKKEQDLFEPVTEFIDGHTMDDSKLRAVIREINDCRFAADKICIVRQEIHSLRDLTEVLSVCFWESECKQLFESFSDREMVVLKDYVKNRPEGWESMTGWERLLES